MDNNKLEIKFRNQSQDFKIINDGILINLNTIKHQLEYKVPFEEIKNEIYTIKNKGDKREAILYASIFFNIILSLFIFAENFTFNLIYAHLLALVLIFPLALLFNEINKGYKEKHIESSKILYFIYTDKNKNQVDNFIKSIFDKRNTFLKNEYLKIDPIIPYHIQNERILWLYTNKYISESEFEIIKEDLDKYFNFNFNINNIQ